jgi:outer membrane immunogenic protein
MRGERSSKRGIRTCVAQKGASAGLNGQVKSGREGRMSRRWPTAIASAAVMIAVSPAGAADEAVRPIDNAAPASLVMPYWTGTYLGAHIGGLFGNKRFTDGDGVIDASSSLRGWLGGLQVGYNHQQGWLVLGVEGEFTWSDARRGFPCFSLGDQVCSAEPEWIGSVAGRIGAAFGPALFYLKGGAAWVHDSYFNMATCSGIQPSGGALCGDLFTASGTRSGWIVGVGGEYRFLPNWSVKVEYDYLRFGERSIEFNDGQGNFFTELIRQDMHLIKAGVNYHFGTWNSAPLLAGEEAANKVLAFSGLDVGKYSLDGWAGVLIAPSKDLDTSGARVWFLGNSGIYKYSAEDTSFHGTFSTGEALAGYGFEGDNYSINVLGGLNAINHMVSPFDPENKVQGTALGIKGRVDAYLTPTQSTMVAGEAEYSTAFGTFYTTGKFGFDVTNGNNIYVGPMASWFGDERFKQWRVGGHLSNLKFGKVEIDISAGYANDSIVGTGAFGHIELCTHFN